MYGSLDEPEELPPKGEFFCKSRDGWMPEIPGMFRCIVEGSESGLIGDRDI